MMIKWKCLLDWYDKSRCDKGLFVSTVAESELQTAPTQSDSDTGKNSEAPGNLAMNRVALDHYRG